MADRGSNRLLLRPMEAAELLGVGRSKLYELIADGNIPTVHIGKRLRIPVEELKAWIQDGINRPSDGLPGGNDG